MLKNSARNCTRYRSSTGTSLNSEKSKFVRCGPRRILRPPLPYVYWAGVSHAAPGVLNEVSNQCVMTGSEIEPVRARFGRLPPEFDTEVARTGVKGSPDCSVRIALVWKLPKRAFSTGFRMS